MGCFCVGVALIQLGVLIWPVFFTGMKRHSEIIKHETRVTQFHSGDNAGLKFFLFSYSPPMYVLGCENEDEDGGLKPRRQ